MEWIIYIGIGLAVIGTVSFLIASILVSQIVSNWEPDQMQIRHAIWRSAYRTAVDTGLQMRRSRRQK